MTTEIEQSEQTLANLQTKRDDWVRRGTELADERSSVAFAAHTGSDQKARAKLDRLNSEIATHASELASLDSAITEANSRLTVTKHNAAVAADREQAQELAEVLETFVECGREIDAVLAIIIEKSKLMEKTLLRMNALGAASPNRNQFETFGALALHTALMQTPWAREFRHLAPRERRTFIEMVDGWLPIVEANIDARLGTNNEEAA
jgi:hypothetical protein